MRRRLNAGSGIAGSLALAITLAAAATLLSGCPTKQQLAEMPGLGEVTVSGPKGKKCFDYCAQSEAGCKHMCPVNKGVCHEDCEIDTKICLQDCPELVRPPGKSQKKILLQY